MKILLLGKNGQLGWEAERQLFGLGNLIAFDFPQIDFTDPLSILELLNQVKPDLIYNAVAYTAVDKAESEVAKATLINATTPGEIASWCQKNQSAFIHFSTDYVFDGAADRDYRESDLPHPLNVYGQSKWEGEKAVLQSDAQTMIFRTSWVYSTRAESFLLKFLNWARINEQLSIVDDQIGNPTWARMLAVLTTRFLPVRKSELGLFFEKYNGIYHLAGGGSASRLEWSQAILDHLEQDLNLRVRQLVGAKTDEFPAPACRPLHSALNCSKFENSFGLDIPHWKISLKLALREING